jgi:putative PIN family toxin of toxin-antitoxin system
VKVVADTMVWVSFCTLEDSYRHRLIQFARRQRVRFLVSEYILTELTTTLVEKLGLSRRYARLARQQVVRIAKLVRLPPSIRRRVPGDPNDDPIVQTALSAKADYLVTADREILNVEKVEDVEIITPTQLGEKLGFQP